MLDNHFGRKIMIFVFSCLGVGTILALFQYTYEEGWLKGYSQGKAFHKIYEDDDDYDYDDDVEISEMKK